MAAFDDNATNTNKLILRAFTSAGFVVTGPMLVHDLMNLRIRVAIATIYIDEGGSIFWNRTLHMSYNLYTNHR